MRGCNTRLRRKAMSAFSAPYSHAFSIGARASPTRLRPEPATSLKGMGLWPRKRSERVSMLWSSPVAPASSVYESSIASSIGATRIPRIEHMHVELDVVADFEHARLLEQGLQKRDRF